MASCDGVSPFGAVRDDRQDHPNGRFASRPVQQSPAE
jgi:hypothetical protein